MLQKITHGLFLSFICIGMLNCAEPSPVTSPQLQTQGTSLSNYNQCDSTFVVNSINIGCDAMNCGAVGSACLSTQYCDLNDAAPVCKDCASGSTVCAYAYNDIQTPVSDLSQPHMNVCVNLQSDPKNCGSCGTSCAQGETCAKGVCTQVACSSYGANAIISSFSGRCFCDTSPNPGQPGAFFQGSTNQSCPFLAVCQNGSCTCNGGHPPCQLADQSWKCLASCS